MPREVDIWNKQALDKLADDHRRLRATVLNFEARLAAIGQNTNLEPPLLGVAAGQTSGDFDVVNVQAGEYDNLTNAESLFCLPWGVDSLASGDKVLVVRNPLNGRRYGVRFGSERKWVFWSNVTVKNTSLGTRIFSQADGGTLAFGSTYGDEDVLGISHDSTEADPFTNGNFTVAIDGVYAFDHSWTVEPDSPWPTSTTSGTTGAASAGTPHTHSYDYDVSKEVRARALWYADSGSGFTGNFGPSGSGTVCAIHTHLNTTMSTDTNVSGHVRFIAALEEGTVLRILCDVLGSTNYAVQVGKSQVLCEYLGPIPS